MPRRPDAVDPSKSPIALFGAHLRHWREFREGSLKGVAAQINTDWSVLGRWERGERLAPIEAVESLDRHYRADGALTSLHALVHAARAEVAPLAGSPTLSDPVVMDEVRRRLLLSVAGVGVSALLPGLEQLRTVVDQRVGGPDLDAWEEIAWEHAHGIVSRPLIEVIRDLSVDLLTLQQTLPPLSSREAAGWARVNARLTFLLAHTLGSAGDRRGSRHWWGSARRAAAQTGDPEFIAAAYAFEAIQALHERRPLAAVLSRVKTALDLTADRPGRAAVAALGSRAHALALMGDHAGAHASLAEQAEAFAMLPDSVTGNAMSAEGCSESRLLHTRSLVLTVIGAPSAPAAQREALDSYPAGRERQAAQIRLHQATSAVREGDITDGLQHAITIVESLEPSRMTQFVLHVAHGVADAAPAGHKAQRAITEYRQHLALTATKEDT
ncbi:helix-turn-helix domain-containing protein [Streptosporangium sp. NBC_01495]|uniref:helix-turn-helix transcriptional regulator n=1 Tax=Streptosporangium sp. NBC_01495 TaxID=2903899 RepID=UPI002E36B361|nr:helix-turn-helix transcriptional regulator [Streptosporangium sp. NBC_01495]